MVHEAAVSSPTLSLFLAPKNSENHAIRKERAIPRRIGRNRKHVLHFGDSSCAGREPSQMKHEDTRAAARRTFRRVQLVHM